MKMNSRTMTKSIGVLALALLVALAFILPGPVDAAERHYEGGNRSIHGSFKTNDLELPETEFQLYWVGSFGKKDKKSTLELFSEYDMELPEIDKPKNEDDGAAMAAWQEAWLTQAETLWEKVQSTGQKPVKTQKTSNHEFTMSGLSSGLYLLVGEAQQVKGYDKNARQVAGKDSWWWPRPMLVQVLQKDVDLSTKPASADVSRFIVEKKWSGGESVEDIVKPKSVDFQIFYDGKQVDTRTLPDADGNWYFTVEGNTKQSDPSKWSFVEVQSQEDKANYMPVVTQGAPVINEQGEWNKLEYTNLYRPSVVITKTMKDVVRRGNQTSVPLVFELTGTRDGKQVYHQTAGMLFKLDGDEEQKIKVKDIPWNLDELKVKEVYSAGTEPKDGSKTASMTTDKDGNMVYSVSFTDSGDITPSTGAINKFKRNGDSHEFAGAEGAAAGQ